jgi:hypothetical protein
LAGLLERWRNPEVGEAMQTSSAGCAEIVGIDSVLKVQQKG